MKDWYSARELAEFVAQGMLGLPTSERRIRERLKKNGVSDRSRSGLGGGKEYHISSLPPETQEFLANQGGSDGCLEWDRANEREPELNLAVTAAADDCTAPANPEANSIEPTNAAIAEQGGFDDNDCTFNIRGGTHTHGLGGLESPGEARFVADGGFGTVDEGAGFVADGRLVVTGEGVGFVADGHGNELERHRRNGPATRSRNEPATRTEAPTRVDSTHLYIGAENSGDLHWDCDYGRNPGDGGAESAVRPDRTREPGSRGRIEPADRTPRLGQPELPIVLNPYEWGTEVKTEPKDRATRSQMIKLVLLTAADHFCKNNGIDKRILCSQSFCALYHRVRFDLVPEWVAVAKPTISWQTLTRWQDELKKNGVAQMADQYGKRKGQNAIEKNPELRNLFEAELLKAPHLGPKQIYLAVKVRYSGDLPSLQIFQRWVKAYKESPLGAAKFTLAENPDRYKNEFMPAFGSRSEGIKALNDLWELDSTLSDTIWELKNGKRYAIIGCIDVYSRRPRLLVNPVSNSDAIAALIRRCLLEWGVPKAIRTDNGKDYTSIHLVNLLQSLEIKHHLCTPFTPEEKPHIERFLGTFNHSFIPYLEGFVGHSVAQRQAIRAREKFADAPETFELRVLSIDKDLAEFQTFCDQWIDWYMQQPHGGLGNKRPLEMIGAQKLVRINERALDVLLMKAPIGNGKRTVQKKGIQVGRLEDGKAAWHIGSWMGDPGVIGRTVYVRLDPSDLGTVYVYGDELAREYLGTAHCAELTGIDRKVIAMKAKHRNKAVRAVVSERKKLAKKFKGVQQDLLDAATAAKTNILTFPGATEQHQAVALEAAELVLKEFEPRAQAPALSAERLAELEEYLQEPEAFESEVDRYHRLRKLQPQNLSAADFSWMCWYCQQPEVQRHIVLPALDFYGHLQVYLDTPVNEQATG